MNDQTGHGTCVASVAFGKVGIMIKGTLVAVKASDSSGTVFLSTTFEALDWAITDIVAKNRQGRSVINISHSKSTVCIQYVRLN